MEIYVCFVLYSTNDRMKIKTDFYVDIRCSLDSNYIQVLSLRFIELKILLTSPLTQFTLLPLLSKWPESFKTFVGGLNTTCMDFEQIDRKRKVVGEQSILFITYLLLTDKLENVLSITAEGTL